MGRTVQFFEAWQQGYRDGKAEAQKRIAELEAGNERLVRQHDLMYDLLVEFADSARFDRTVTLRAEEVLQALAGEDE